MSCHFLTFNCKIDSVQEIKLSKKKCQVFRKIPRDTVQIINLTAHTKMSKYSILENYM